jgi:succinate dehydrogenase / fumarate reductase, cytochrome b subunit
MERPLLPFKFPRWYRFQITSGMSILQRLTGIALALGSMLIAWWLTAAAAGGALFVATHAFISSPIGVPLLFAWPAAWDAGYGFELPDAYPTEKAECSAEQAYAAAGVRFPDPTSSALPVSAREEYHDRFDD